MSSPDPGTDSDMPPRSLKDESPAGASDSEKTEVLDGKGTFTPTREFFLAFAALMTLALAVSIDATSLSVALPIISSALDGTALEAFWSGTSFLLASTVLQPTVASLSNIFGRKYVSSDIRHTCTIDG